MPLAAAGVSCGRRRAAVLCALCILAAVVTKGVNAAGFAAPEIISVFSSESNTGKSEGSVEGGTRLWVRGRAIPSFPAPHDIHFFRMNLGGRRAPRYNLFTSSPPSPPPRPPFAT